MPILAGSLEHVVHHDAYQIRMLQFLSKGHGANNLFPALLAGIVGVGALKIAYADAGEVYIVERHYYYGIEGIIVSKHFQFHFVCGEQSIAC